MKLFVKCSVISLALVLGIGWRFSVSHANDLRAQEEGTAQAKASIKSAKASSAKPDAVFRQNCARCHGADGRGETPLGKIYNAPNFADAEWQKRFSNKEFTASITHGHGGMPAFEKKLSKKQIASLVPYVRRFKN
jgi:mono/diheme cytochrome c family protein